jgi:hypothetical protein
MFAVYENGKLIGGMAAHPKSVARWLASAPTKRERERAIALLTEENTP